MRLVPWMGDVSEEILAVSKRLALFLSLGSEISSSLLLLLLLSHFSVSDSVQPHGRQPTSLPRPWDFPGKNTGVGCHFLLQCVKVKTLSRVRLLATPYIAAYQAPSSMGFSRQEYWSGLPLPFPAVPWPGIKPVPSGVGAQSSNHWTAREVP